MANWKLRQLNMTELDKRLASAAFMIPFGLFIVWQGGWWLMLGCALVAGLMAYEWAMMSGLHYWWPMALIAALMPVLAGLGQSQILLAGFALGCVIALISALQDRSYTRPAYVAIFGFIYVSLLAIGLIYLRAGDWRGVWAALLVMSFVWASDAGAFFVGRQIGGPKLLASESPNKTWAGAIGAVVASALCGVVASFLLDASVTSWVLMGMAISIVAQIGDMFESGLKRRLGAKDSSSLVPGHGGVLDRVDGLGLVCGAAALAFTFIPGLTRMLGLL